PKANNRPTSKQSTLTGGLMLDSPRSLRTEPTDTNEILVAIQQLGNRFDSVDTKISNIDSNVQEMKAQNVLLQDQIKDLVSANSELKQENDELQKRLKTLEDKMDDVEARSRRNNILVHGLPPDNEQETWIDCEKVVRKMINNHLEIDDARIQIDRAHRLRSNNGTGAINVRITHYKDKENIMKNKKKPKDTNIHISDDYTPRIREIRRKLSPFLNKFRNEGKRATMVYDHLIVDVARLCWDPITGTPSQWWSYFKNLLNPQGDTNTDSHDQTEDNTNQNLIDDSDDDCSSENAGLPTIGGLNVADNHNVNCPSYNSIFNEDADAQMTLNNCVNDIDEPKSQVEIVRAIRKIKTGKACGPDGIPPELYKCEFSLMIDYLKVLFNTIYESGIHPKEWTNSMIFPLHKKAALTM
ncbi:SH3 domain protein, partial [Elysia marginata]